MKKLFILLFLIVLASGCTLGDKPIQNSGQEKSNGLQVEVRDTNSSTINLEDSKNQQADNITEEDEPIGLKIHVKNGEKIEIIKINNGINNIDLNNDGIMDMVFAAQRENGTSPHWYSIYTFAVNAPQLPIFGADSKKPYWHSAIIWKGYKDDSQDETSYYDNLTTVEGADGALQDISLIKSKNKKPVLVIARREFGESYADSQIVRFHFYDLVENSKAEDWSSNYSYEYRDTATTDSTYTDVNEAISKELINKY